MREVNAVDKYIRINPRTRLFEPNWMYRDILPYALGPDPSRYANGVISVGATVPVTVPYKLPHSSLGYDDQVGTPLQINQIVFTNSGNPTAHNMLVSLADMGDQRQYMNYPIHSETFAGSGQLSARLTEDLFLPTRHQLLLTLLGDGTLDIPASVQFYFWGKYYDTFSSNLQTYPEDHAAMIKLINQKLERRKYVTPYWLTTPPSTGRYAGVLVPANQTIEIDALVGDEGHFECSHILRNFGNTDGVPTVAPFELELINPQTRQSIMNGRIHSQFIGNAYNPQPFPAPFIIPAGQLLRFKITDLSGADNTVYLTLRGMKIRAPFKSRAEVDKEFGVVNHTPQPKIRSMAAEMRGA